MLTSSSPFCKTHGLCATIISFDIRLTHLLPLQSLYQRIELWSAIPGVTLAVGWHCTCGVLQQLPTSEDLSPDAQFSQVNTPRAT